MKKIVLLFLLATLLVAQNPKIYSALGNVVYDSVQKIEKLKEISKYSKFKEKIDTYAEEVERCKNIGYEIEKGDKSLEIGEYLQSLRALSKTNDFFYKTVLNSFKSSMKDEDSELFIQTINSGLLDTDKYKSEILEYYFAHSSDIDAPDILKKYIDEVKTVKIQQKLSKQQIQEARIKRIRKSDKAKQEALQKALEKELIQKKINIRKEQMQELIK